jgi:hypothetical protein
MIFTFTILFEESTVCDFKNLFLLHCKVQSCKVLQNQSFEAVVFRKMWRFQIFEKFSRVFWNPNLIYTTFGWLVIYSYTSNFSVFVTITGGRAANLDLCSARMAFSSERSHRVQGRMRGFCLATFGVSISKRRKT